MAAVFDPQAMPSLPPSNFAHTSPHQVSISCVGLLYDAASNRTFRIPDVPATSSVAHIKQWYAKNVSDSADPRSLVVIHNAQPVEDSAQVWQLAQGQGQFAVTVAQAQSPRSTLSLFVDTALPIPPIPLCISSDSTVLYVKQRLFEMLNLPMALASAVQTTLILPPSSSPLQNDLTLESCGIINNARLALAFQQDNTPDSFQAQALGAQPQYARIKEIWGDNAGNANYSSQVSPVRTKTVTPTSHGLLPSLLFEDEDDEEASVLCEYIGAPVACNPPQCFQNGNSGNNHSQHSNVPKGRGGRRQRSRSPNNTAELSQDQLQHLAANFRTKTCRNGPSCKFGRNCWFAHTTEELRKPSDPLPNNLPAVHKLERYSHREANAAKDRHGT